MKGSFLDILNSSKQLIINPKLFWISKKEDLDSQKYLLLSFLVPYILLVTFAVFVSDLFGNSDFILEIQILNSLQIIILFTLQYFVSVFFTNELIKTFGGEKDIIVSRNLVVYSMIPFLLIYTFTNLIPFFGILNIIGFYGFYIFWIGVNELLTFPENKKSSYTIIAIVMNFFVFSFLSITLSKIIKFFY